MANYFNSLFYVDQIPPSTIKKYAFPINPDMAASKTRKHDLRKDVSERL